MLVIELFALCASVIAPCWLIDKYGRLLGVIDKYELVLNNWKLPPILKILFILKILWVIVGGLT